MHAATACVPALCHFARITAAIVGTAAPELKLKVSLRGLAT